MVSGPYKTGQKFPFVADNPDYIVHQYCQVPILKFNFGICGLEEFYLMNIDKIQLLISKEHLILLSLH